MSAPVSVPARQTERRGRLWWLPSDGCGNGLDDDAWAPVLEVSHQTVPALLEILREGEAEAVLLAAMPLLTRNAGKTWR